jgi:hypothetical protein
MREFVGLKPHANPKKQKAKSKKQKAKSNGNSKSRSLWETDAWDDQQK